MPSTVTAGAAYFRPIARALAHVLDALARQSLDARRVVEHLDRDPAAIVDLAQCREDRHEVQLAEARSLLVGIVGVEVLQQPTCAGGSVRGSASASLDMALQSRMQPAVAGEPIIFDQPHRLGGRVQKIALGRAQRLDGTA